MSRGQSARKITLVCSECMLRWDDKVSLWKLRKSATSGHLCKTISTHKPGARRDIVVVCRRFAILSGGPLLLLMYLNRCGVILPITRRLSMFASEPVRCEKLMSDWKSSIKSARAREHIRNYLAAGVMGSSSLWSKFSTIATVCV
jgi:hypothetical protein